jgi:hypothetical protein
MKIVLVSCLLLAACNNSKKTAPAPTPAPSPTDPPAVVVVDKALPPIDQMPGIEFVGEPIEQDPAFPKHKWVRTVLFDGKTPYIGFTYVDATKGNSIKGEQIDGLSEAEIKKRLHADFPSSSMQPIPAGHPITLLTADDIKKYDLPAEPAWVQYYK